MWTIACKLSSRLAIHPPLAIRGFPALSVRALGSEYQEALTSDEARLTITLTGHWWYQGVHAVHPHARGAQVTYVVRNIAHVARALAFLQRPFYVKQMRREFEQLV
jgi:hypothetical protein